MIRIADVTKIYDGPRGSVNGLDRVSISIDKGSFVTVTGGSGSGKTTLLVTLGGLLRPTTGSVKVDGHDLYSLKKDQLSRYRNRKIGFVLQTFNLIPYLSALENVMVPMIFAPENGNGGRRPRAESLLERMGLGERSLHLPRELSVGQQQRVAIARALANDPDLILADEPTGNLDPALAMEILEILRKLNEDEGKTIIMVTHSPAAAAFGSHRLNLRNGRLI
jgi:putative ABC transport system ATP-binding protein